MLATKKDEIGVSIVRGVPIEILSKQPASLCPDERGLLRLPTTGRLQKETKDMYFWHDFVFGGSMIWEVVAIEDDAVILGLLPNDIAEN